MSKTSVENSPMQELTIYWRRFVGLGTAYVRKYQVDPFFRTEVHVVALQILFSLAIVMLMGAALTLLYQASLSSILSDLQIGIASSPAGSQAARILPVQSFMQVQATPLIIIFAAAVLLIIAFGYLMNRIALIPAKDALASQKQFIGNIAHELRTPLSIIKMNTEVALMDGVPDALRSTLDSNVEELDRISEIINNLLSLNTLVRPGGMEFTNVDLGTAAENAIKALTPLAERRGVSLSIRLSDFRMARGNAAALEQVATNIIKNAITYSSRDGHVSVTVEPDYRGSILLTVEDSGVGIAEKDLFRIFEPFYRGTTSRVRADSGSGLGLAIVSELVHLHRGKIFVRSVVKRGTVVTVSIPAGKTPEEAREEKHVGSESEITVDFTTRS